MTRAQSGGTHEHASPPQLQEIEDGDRARGTREQRVEEVLGEAGERHLRSPIT